MKTLELKQMENVQGGSQNRDCLIDGAITLIGAGTFIFGGWALMVGAIGHAAGIGCFG